MNNLKRKSSLEPTLLGENEGIVFFDSETGGVHILDEVAADILACFENEQCTDKTVETLCAMYDEDRSVIEADVKAFIDELVQRGLLVHGEA